MISELRVIDSRRELARDRAEKLVAGKWSIKVNVDPVWGVDLSTYRCALCDGNFPERCFALMWYEDEVTCYAHWGCGQEVENWVWSSDDYPETA